MDNESIEKLRFDSRLVQRRGWVTPEQLQQELESLPDVSDKIRVVEEEPEAPAPEPAGSGVDRGLPGGGDASA